MHTNFKGTLFYFIFFFNCEMHPGKSVYTGQKTSLAVSSTQSSGDGRQEDEVSKQNKSKKTVFLLLLLQFHHICISSD